MSIDQSTRRLQRKNYTYPEFVIDERSGKITVNLIDQASGKVVRHIPSVELNQLLNNTSSSVDGYAVA